MAVNALIPSAGVPGHCDDLSYHEKTPVCSELKWDTTQRYFPVAVIDTKSNFIDFAVPKSPSLYMDLSSLEVVLEGRFLRNDGQEITDRVEEDVIFPKSHFLRALFKQIEIYLNEVPIAQLSDSHHSIQDAVMHCLKDGYKEQDSSLSYERILYDLDNDGPSETLHLKEAEEDEEERKYALDRKKCSARVMQRYELSKGSNTFAARGKILPYGMRHLRYIPNNVNLRVRLVRSAPEYYIRQWKPNTSGQANHYFNIQSCELRLDWYSLYQAPLLGLERALLRSPAILPFTYLKEHVQILPANTQEYRIEKLHTPFIPENIIAVCMKLSTLDGNLKSDQHSFDHCNISELELLVDRDVRPGNCVFKNDFSDKDSLHESFATIARNVGSCPARSEFTPERFSKNRAVWLFRLTPKNVSDVPYTFPLVAGTVGMRVKFSQALSETHVLLIFTTERASLKIEGSERSVTVESYY